jgi:hypothetical protein
MAWTPLLLCSSTLEFQLNARYAQFCRLAALSRFGLSGDIEMDMSLLEIIAPG